MKLLNRTLILFIALPFAGRACARIRATVAVGTAAGHGNGDAARMVGQRP